MGWFYDNPDLPQCYDHEGYVVALTHRTADRTSGLYVELGYPDKGIYEPEAIPRIQAGCACGWRSPHIVPQRGEYKGDSAVFRLPRYTPCAAWVTESDEARCGELWAEHIHHAVPGLGARRMSNSEQSFDHSTADKSRLEDVRAAGAFRKTHFGKDGF